MGDMGVMLDVAGGVIIGGIALGLIRFGLGIAMARKDDTGLHHSLGWLLLFIGLAIAGFIVIYHTRILSRFI
jgi:uncharacterized membrane protein